MSLHKIPIPESVYLTLAISECKTISVVVSARGCRKHFDSRVETFCQIIAEWVQMRHNKQALKCAVNTHGYFVCLEVIGEWAQEIPESFVYYQNGRCIEGNEVPLCWAMRNRFAIFQWLRSNIASVSSYSREIGKIWVGGMLRSRLIQESKCINWGGDLHSLLPDCDELFIVVKYS